MRVAQVGLSEHDDDRAIVLHGAEIHLAHQPGDDPRAVELGAGMGVVEGEACDRQAAAALGRLIDGGREVAVERGRRQQAGAGIDQTLGVDRAQGAAEPLLERMLAQHRQRDGGGQHGRD